MRARDTDEPHRTSTPLELLFDLCFVVAVSQAARELSQSLALNHLESGIQGYLMVFFAIWWAWVNFTWFASAYDVDDVPYRLLTFVQIIGVLILAAGVPAAFRQGNFTVATIGYVVMRVALVTQWLRAAHADPVGRSAARRYALGVTVVQIGWITRLFVPHSVAEVAFYVLAVAEHGMSSGDFAPALEEFFGSAAGLSASVITRLTTDWQRERDQFAHRSLKEVDYVYLYADGIHFNVRLDEARLCVLVIVGVRVDGTKELVSITDGHRESTESWADVLRDLKRRGMRTPVLAVGDGALGFWGALSDVFPDTTHQRCWVHKMANVMNALPKSAQPAARAALADMIVPAFAEWGGRGTSWHPEHISERYGLFTLIVLGECVAAATIAMQEATTFGLSAGQIGVAAGGLLLIFSFWWWYFEHPAEEGLRMSRNLAFLWGYAHYFVFASVAALGAGLEVALESTHHATGVSPTTAGGAVAVAVSVYLLVTGVVLDRLQPGSVLKMRFIAPFVVLVLVIGFSAGGLTVGFALPLMGLIVVALVIVDHRASTLRPEGPRAG